MSDYISNNAISSAELPDLLGQVHTRLRSLVEDELQLARPDPAVPISKSITRNHIICLEDGAKLKMLKRYLRTRYDMTPEVPSAVGFALGLSDGCA